jgi:hypothetical protein
MAIEPEKSWHYLILRRAGASAEEARNAVPQNQRRVAVNRLIDGYIFEKEIEAISNQQVGMPTNLFNPHIN